jgi:hypothetical protein
LDHLAASELLYHLSSGISGLVKESKCLVNQILAFNLSVSVIHRELAGLDDLGGVLQDFDVPVPAVVAVEGFAGYVANSPLHD